MKVISVLFCLGAALCGAAEQEWKIDGVEVDRVCFKPGQTAGFRTTLHYSGDKPVVEARVSVDVYSELDRQEPAFSEVMRFQPGVAVPLAVSWNVPLRRKWGHEVRVHLQPLPEGSTPLIRSAYFAVGEHSWQVGHWTGCCNTGGLKTPEEVKTSVIEGYHRWHVTAIDYFSWQPSGWETMAPEEDDWVSGQTGYVETKRVLRDIINQAHERGMEVYSYYRYDSWGPAGVEFIRTHPEWWSFDRFGKPFPKGCEFDIAVLDKMRNREKLTALPWCRFYTGVIWRDDIEEFMFDQLRQSVEMFGWDGFRSDGLPAPANVYDREGTYHEVIEGDPINAEMAWIQTVRSRLKDEISPDCVMHFNASSVSYGLEKTDRQLFQERARGSYCLWEGAYLASMPGSDLNNMKTFATYLHEEVKASREVGGYRHLGWMRTDGELLEATATACGGQIDWNNGWDGKPSSRGWGPFSWRSFTFRFSRYFWDPALKHIENTSELFDVAGPDSIWWEGLAQERIEDDGTRCLALHLINLHDGYPTIREAPQELENIPVTLNLGESKRVEAFALSPRDGYPGFVEPLTVERTKGGYRVVTPHLKQWTVVVFRISDEE